MCSENFNLEKTRALCAQGNLSPFVQDVMPDASAAAVQLHALLGLQTFVLAASDCTAQRCNWSKSGGTQQGGACCPSGTCWEGS